MKSFLVALVVCAHTVVGTTPAVPTPTPASVVVQIPPGGDKDCLANYIVKQCLQTESDKLSACTVTDYQCICYASQAIATCYNNCPNDTRGPLATQAMNAACAAAAQYSAAQPQHSPTPLASGTSTGSGSGSSPAHTTGPATDAPNPTDVVAPSGSSSAGGGTSKTSGAAGRRAVNVVGVVALAVVAVVGTGRW